MIIEKETDDNRRGREKERDFEVRENSAQVKGEHEVVASKLH